MKRWLRRIIILLVRLYGAMGASAASRQARQLVIKFTCPPDRIPRILLIRPDNLGDLVLTTPVLRALKTRAPEVHITMMIGPWASEVVARNPDVDQLLTCPFPNLGRAHHTTLQQYILLLRTAKQLQGENYDIAINLRPHYWWGAALLYLAGIPHRIGYAIEPGTGTPFLTEVLPARDQEHSTVSCLRLASAGLKTLGYSSLDEPYTPYHYPLHFVPTAQEQQWVTERLSAEGIDLSTFIVVIHPGTGAAVKLWKPESWAACATKLTHFSASSTAIHIILTGSPSERSLLEEIARSTTARTTIVVDATLGQLAALLQRAQLVLGVDSGPLHLAVAQNTPTVRIFGPTDPCNFGPWGKQEQHAVVVSTHRCSACPFIPCRRLDFRPEELEFHPCVRLVSERQVLAAIARQFPSLLASSENGAQV